MVMPKVGICKVGSRAKLCTGARYGRHRARAFDAFVELATIGCLRTMRLEKNLHAGSPWVEALPDYRARICSEKADFIEPLHRINLNMTSRCGYTMDPLR